MSVLQFEMENNINSPPPTAKHLSEVIINNTESAERFQKFIHELFDKNGVLNDLRAYLRGHIVDVLKSAQTGDTPTCQKHFTQRLELNFQALNILIAEYLLRLEFSYTLSVFVSELPLANMVFDFSKSLMEKSGNDPTRLRFNDNDVWSILNYLGIKCDSEHASLMMKTYKSEEHTPLLLVILKCTSFYRKNKDDIEGNNSSSSGSFTSIDEKHVKTMSGHKITLEKCSHATLCKLCQVNIAKLKDKYRKRKHFKRKNKSSIDSLNVGPLIQNIGTVERKLIDEMFQQLKTVYDAEIETLRADEERKLRQSLALQALQLHQKRQKMEESFREREKQLEQNVQQKKQFLWGLAKALRDQHAQMSRAMHAVKCETAKLDAKEDSLKTQIDEAQEVLRKRGEDMRNKISEELAILEGHVQSMKCERERICRERCELEQLRKESDIAYKAMNSQAMENENDNIRQHYDLLKNELCILKKYLEMTKVAPKCVIERSTITELSDVGSKISIVLNNEQELDKYVREEDRLNNQLVNEFKKSKNVNFSQGKSSSNLSELYLERSAEQRSSESSIGENNATRQLREENQRLKALAQQQRDQISSLSAQQERLQAGMRAAAASNRPQAFYFNSDNVASTSIRPSIGCRAGAGEELGLFGNAHPRILVPGDALPFVGVLRDRHNDNRRQAAYAQLWRSRRPSPPPGTGRRLSPKQLTPERTESGPTISAPLSAEDSATASDTAPPPARDCVSFQPIPCAKASPLRERPRAPAPCPLDEPKNREKSPKSMLREAKENLRSKPTKPPTAREKSPCSVLREAKARLRKLEIEAAAVEKSYFDFRKRQTALREERGINEEAIVTKDIPELGIRRSRSLQKLDYNKQKEPTGYPTFTKIDYESNYEQLTQQSLDKDFDTYLAQFPKFNIQESFNKNKLALEHTSPITQGIQEKIEIENQKLDPKENYLQQPLTEFRKLYNSQNPRSYWPEDSRKTEIVSRNSRPTTPKGKSRAPSPVKNYNEFDATNVEIPTIYRIEESQTLNAKKEALKKAKDKKQAELEILKTNLTKIYNLKELPKDINENRISEESDNFSKGSAENDATKNANSLRIEIENADESKELEPAKIDDKNKKNLQVLVQSRVENDVNQSESDNDAPIERMHANMTIIISPKRSATNHGQKSRSPERKRSVSPEQAAKLTRNDVLDAIFQKEKESTGSLDTKNLDEKSISHESSKENLEDNISEVERDENDDYADDFSDDLDEYNQSAELNMSPISLGKPEPDDFWKTEP